MPIEGLWMFSQKCVHHEMPPPGTFGGTLGLGGADGFGGTGENNVMYAGAVLLASPRSCRMCDSHVSARAGDPVTKVDKIFGFALPPDARAPRTQVSALHHHCALGACVGTAVCRLSARVDVFLTPLSGWAVGLMGNEWGPAGADLGGLRKKKLHGTGIAPSGISHFIGCILFRHDESSTKLSWHGAGVM